MEKDKPSNKAADKSNPSAAATGPRYDAMKRHTCKSIAEQQGQAKGIPPGKAADMIVAPAPAIDPRHDAMKRHTRKSIVEQHVQATDTPPDTVADRIDAPVAAIDPRRDITDRPPQDFVVEPSRRMADTPAVGRASDVMRSPPGASTSINADMLRRKAMEQHQRASIVKQATESMDGEPGKNVPPASKQADRATPPGAPDRPRATSDFRDETTDRTQRSTMRRYGSRNAPKATAVDARSAAMQQHQKRSVMGRGGKTAASAGVAATRQLGDVAKSGVRRLGADEQQSQNNVADASAQAAQRSLQETQKAYRRTRQAQEIVKKTVKTVQKIIQKTAQAAQRTVKATTAAASGGLSPVISMVVGFALVIIVVVVFIAFLLTSPVGVTLMASDDRDQIAAVMASESSRVSAEIDARIKREEDRLSSRGCDRLEVLYIGDADGDSDLLGNAPEILIVYATLISMREDNPQPAFEVTDDHVALLREIFRKMVTVSYKTSTREEKSVQTVTKEDGTKAKEEVVLKILVLEVTMGLKTAEDAYKIYGFTEEMKESAEELFNEPYFYEILSICGIDIGSSVDTSSALANITGSNMGSQAVQTAFTKLGRPYVSGKKGPNSFDCSGLVIWSFKQIDPERLGQMPGYASGQASWCYKNKYVVWAHPSIATGFPATFNIRSGSAQLAQLQPGDLIFWRKPCSCGKRWKEVHHVGFYVGDEMIIDASSSKGRVVYRRIWSGSSWPIVMIARPYAAAAE